MSRESSVSPRVPQAKEGKSEEVFEVEKILNHKIDGTVFMLKVRWLGYGEAEDTWEPEADIKECASEVVQEYYNRMKVNDKTELIGSLQKSISRSKAKRKREESDVDSGSASDSSFTSPKSSSSSKKSTKKRARSGESFSVKKAKVPTKAALKSYEAHSSTTPVVPNNAKKAAIEVRGRNWLEEMSDRDSDDEADAPVETEIEKLANKCKEKAVKDGTLGSPMVAKAVSSMVAKAVLSTGSTRKSPSPRMQPCSSSSFTSAVNQRNGSKEASVTVSRIPSILSTPAIPEPETQWTVEGMVRHTDSETNSKRKLVLMNNKESGERRVVGTREAFALDGWALTKYLLDRCEF